jgi:hypothetical protein
MGKVKQAMMEQQEKDMEQLELDFNRDSEYEEYLMGYVTHNDGFQFGEVFTNLYDFIKEYEQYIAVPKKGHVGYITCTYFMLEKLFGKPHKNFDSSKSDAQWDIKFNEGGAEIEIYNKRSSVEPIPKEIITHWNVSGDKKGFYKLEILLEENNGNSREQG